MITRTFCCVCQKEKKEDGAEDYDYLPASIIASLAIEMEKYKHVHAAMLRVYAMDLSQDDKERRLKTIKDFGREITKHMHALTYNAQEGQKKPSSHGYCSQCAAMFREETKATMEHRGAFAEAG